MNEEPLSEEPAEILDKKSLKKTIFADSTDNRLEKLSEDTILRAGGDIYV